MALKDLVSIYQEGMTKPTSLKNSDSPVDISSFKKPDVTGLDSELNNLIEFNRTSITELPRNSTFSQEIDVTPKSPLAELK